MKTLRLKEPPQHGGLSGARLKNYTQLHQIIQNYDYHVLFVRSAEARDDCGCSVEGASDTPEAYGLTKRPKLTGQCQCAAPLGLIRPRLLR